MMVHILLRLFVYASISISMSFMFFFFIFKSYRFFFLNICCTLAFDICVCFLRWCALFFLFFFFIIIIFVRYARACARWRFGCFEMSASLSESVATGRIQRRVYIRNTFVCPTTIVHIKIYYSEKCLVRRRRRRSCINEWMKCRWNAFTLEGPLLGARVRKIFYCPQPSSSSSRIYFIYRFLANTLATTTSIEMDLIKWEKNKYLWNLFYSCEGCANVGYKLSLVTSFLRVLKL